VKRIHERLLLQDNPDALLAIAENGEILHWNNAAEAIFGYSRKESLGRQLNDLINMSHELRTPLNAIIGFAGTLLMRLPGPLSADQEKQLKIVQSSARYLLALINDLLDVAKIEAGKIDLLHFHYFDGSDRTKSTSRSRALRGELFVPTNRAATVAK
jgi:signal transduction histidine kinase